MIETLRIVRGAVSTKDFVPILTHVAVHEGRVHAFDGRVAISAPIDLPRSLSFTVPLIPFVAALEACEGAKIKVVHKDESVTVTAGTFRATLPTGKIADFPFSLAQKSRTKINKMKVLPVLELMKPFIGLDASRPWCRGILVKGEFAYATNNVVLVEATWPFCLDAATLSTSAIDELLRIHLEPVAYSRTDTTLVFYMEGDITLEARMLEDKWPDAHHTLQLTHEKAKLVKIAPELLDAVQRIKPLCPNADNPLVILEESTIKTLDGALCARIEGVKGGYPRCAFIVDPLLSVLGVAERADWSRFPRIPFKGRTPTGVDFAGVLLGLMGI